jgi:hypothetical protein
VLAAFSVRIINELDPCNRGAQELLPSYLDRLPPGLDRIEQETGWQPDDACFVPKGWWNPPAIKEHLLRTRVFPVYGEDACYIAIESNPRSREMYARLKIPCYWVTEEGTCLTDGERILKRLPR